jgi:hypothetical protein
MLGLGLIVIIAAGIIVLLAAALGIVAIAISGRESRQTVSIIVVASLLALFCCLAAVAGAFAAYFYGMPK